MNITKPILIVLLLGMNLFVQAQENTTIPTHSLNLLIGLGQGQVKEKTASRLIYKGLNIPVGLEYRLTNKKHQFKIGANGYFSKPKSRFDDKALWVNYTVSVGYNQLINLKDDWQIRLGGEIPFQTTIDFFESIQAEYFYWITSISLNPTFRLERTLENENSLFVETSFPLLGSYARPPLQRFTNAEDNFTYILSETNKNHRFFILPQHQQFELNVGYHYQLNNKVNQSISYRLQYLKNTDPKSISLIIHQLYLRTSLNWSKS